MRAVPVQLAYASPPSRARVCHVSRHPVDLDGLLIAHPLIVLDITDDPFHALLASVTGPIYTFGLPILRVRMTTLLFQTFFPSDGLYF